MYQRFLSAGANAAASVLDNVTALKQQASNLLKTVPRGLQALRQSPYANALAQKAVGAVTAGALTVLLQRAFNDQEESDIYYYYNDRLWYFMLGSFYYLLGYPSLEAGLQIAGKKFTTLAKPETLAKINLVIQSTFDVASSAAANYITLKKLKLPYDPFIGSAAPNLPRSLAIVLTALSSYKIFLLFEYLRYPDSFKTGSYDAYAKFFRGEDPIAAAQDSRYQHYLKKITSSPAISRLCIIVEKLNSGLDLASTCSMLAAFIINYSYDSWHKTDLNYRDDNPNLALIINFIAVMLGFLIGTFATLLCKNPTQFSEKLARFQNGLSTGYFLSLIQTDLAIFLKPNAFAVHTFLQQGVIACSVSTAIAALGAAISYNNTDHVGAVPTNEHRLAMLPIEPEDSRCAVATKSIGNFTLELFNFMASPYFKEPDNVVELKELVSQPNYGTITVPH